MKTDINGCSTCPAGSEHYETYLRHKSQQLIQYDYRHTDGKLFSTVSSTLEKCREKKNEWIKTIINT